VNTFPKTKLAQFAHNSKPQALPIWLMLISMLIYIFLASIGMETQDLSIAPFVKATLFHTIS